MMESMKNLITLSSQTNGALLLLYCIQLSIVSVYFQKKVIKFLLYLLQDLQEQQYFGMLNQAIAKNPLFRVLEKGDRQIKISYRKAIILVGLTRAGKSTIFNWILKKPMIGKGKVSTYYVTATDDGAQVGDSFSSVTLVPNIYKDLDKDVSLIDMAGYEDTRDYIGVIGVSYFLKALFEQVRQAKFVIVFDENKFREQGGSGIIKTFSGFINMFHYRQMSPEIQNKLKQSISVVITHSERPTTHFDYFDDIIEKLQNPALEAENKDLVIQLMKYLRQSARIQAFLAAKQNANPQQCTFIQRFDTKLQWKYFNFDKADEATGKSVISLPFNKDFDKISSLQRLQFQSAITKRLDSYLQFSDILKSLVGNFIKNWNIFLNNWKTKRIIEQNYSKMQEMFCKIKQFTQSNDCYSCMEIIDVKFKVSYDPPTFIQSVKTILQIENIVEQIASNGQKHGIYKQFQFSQAMNDFTNKFTDILNHLKIFCMSKEQEQYIERLKFILCRGFRQFQMLYQLRDIMIADAKQKLRDNCNSVFDQDNKQFIQRFVNEFNSDLLVKVFPTLELLDQYLQFFMEYEQQYKQDKPITFFNQQKGNIQTAKADILLSLGQLNKALQCLIKSTKSIGLIIQQARISSKTDQQKTAQIKSLSMKRLKNIRKIINILKIIPQNSSFNPKLYALDLCKQNKLIDDGCQIYQLIIDSQTNVFKKTQMLENYANYCAKWGRIDQALIMLQKKLSIEEDVEGYERTINLMECLMTQKETYLKDFNIALIAMKKFSENDQDLELKLNEITHQLESTSQKSIEK